jgi:hypothetical protein
MAHSLVRGNALSSDHPIELDAVEGQPVTVMSALRSRGRPMSVVHTISTKENSLRSVATGDTNIRST